MLDLKRKSWSPYAAGIVIGLLQIPAFMLVDTALGASSSFVTVAGLLASPFDSALGEAGYFAKYLAAGKYHWQLALVIGIALGAMLSARLSGAARQPMSPIWSKATDITSLAQRSLMGFGGGFVLLFGARRGGGCTSGHGISGMAQLAIGSTIAVAAMFAGGIMVASLYRRI